MIVEPLDLESETREASRFFFLKRPRLTSSSPVPEMSEPINNSSRYQGRLAGDSLERFAATADAVAATAKKIEKGALLGAYFTDLNDTDLARATRYFAGQQFALSDSRTTNVGGRIIGNALAEAAGFSV